MNAGGPVPKPIIAQVGGYGFYCSHPDGSPDGTSYWLRAFRGADVQTALRAAAQTGWRQLHDNSMRCPPCVTAYYSAGPLPLAPMAPTPAPTSTRPLNVSTVRAADLLTYCDHCGYTLVGEYDDHSNVTILRCPTTNAVQQVIPVADTAAWSEWALEKLYRMCKNR